MLRLEEEPNDTELRAALDAITDAHAYITGRWKEMTPRWKN